MQPSRLLIIFEDINKPGGYPPGLTFYLNSPAKEAGVRPFYYGTALQLFIEANMPAHIYGPSNRATARLLLYLT